jgi:hypothetical protein
MGKPKQNPYQTTSDLIANTIGTAKVLGENQRITNLVASSIGRFVLEMDNTDSGDELLSHALSCINSQDAELVPKLHSALNALLLSRA